MMETGADSAMHKCTEQEFGAFMESDGKKIIWSIIHRYGNGLDHEEAFQELQIALWKALSAYEPSLKTKKTTFVYAAVYNQIKMMIREQNAEKRMADRQSSPLEVHPNLSDPGCSMEDQAIDKQVKESRANALQWAIRNGGLTDDERVVICQTIREIPQTVIGAELSCSQPHVSVLKARAIKKIRAALQDAHWDGESIMCS